MGEVELSCQAYVKMYLHACLFPRCSVNGLLLSSNPAGGALCVTDCVPLLHSHLPLAPITQVALTQVGQCAMIGGYTDVICFNLISTVFFSTWNVYLWLIVDCYCGKLHHQSELIFLCVALWVKYNWRPSSGLTMIVCWPQKGPLALMTINVNR